MSKKVLYGQAWVCKNSVYQDQTVFENGVLTDTQTVVLIENIWDELSKEGLESSNDKKINGDHSAPNYKYNKKGNFFYWDYIMTNLEDEEVIVKLECPKPTPEFFEKYFFKNGENEVKFGFYETYDYETINEDFKYARYYGKKLQDAGKNMLKHSVIQVGEIDINAMENTSTAKIPGKNIEPGDTYTEDAYTIKQNDFGDITNLLGLF